jgi:hypothetical protein
VEIFNVNWRSAGFGGVSLSGTFGQGVSSATLVSRNDRNA